MKRHFIAGLSLLAIMLFTGCFFFKKSGKPKESPAMASEMEEAFKTRWVDKRSAELIAQGQTADGAHTQATEEFRVRYGFTKAAQK